MNPKADHRIIDRLREGVEGIREGVEGKGLVYPA